MPSKSDMEIIRLKKEWRRLQKIKERRQRDQITRIDNYESNRLEVQIEIEQAELMKKKKHLEEQIRDIERQIIKKPKKKKAVANEILS